MKRSVWLGTMIVLGALAGGAQAQVALEWKLKAGDKFWLESVSTSKQVMKTVGRELKQDLEQTTVFAINVLSANPGGDIELEQTLEWLTVKTAGPMSQSDDRYNQQLSGLKFKVKRSAKGEVTLDGYEALVEKIAGKDLNAQDAVRKVLTPDSLKQSATDLFSQLPEKPVKTADSWERKLLKPLGPIGSMETTRKYSYDGQETIDGKALEKITFTGTATYAPPRPNEATPFLFQVIKGELKVDDLRGNAHFDAKEGRLVKSEWTMRLKGFVTISVSGSNIETEAVQDMTVKTRLLDKAPPKPDAPPG